MPEWVPIFALPNIKLQEPVEIDGIAIVSALDPRIIALTAKHQKFKEFLQRFATEFSRPITPSFIMIRDDAPPIYSRVDALASFRDVLSISVITHTWANTFQFGRGGHYGPQYANS